MCRHAFCNTVVVAVASAASAATLTLTPDAQTYTVGDLITLSVLGDPESEQSKFVFGRLLFDAEVASYVESSQQPLLTSFGQSAWSVGALTGGIDAEGRGFGDAFLQSSGELEAVPNALIASVTLVAVSPGLLTFDWQTDGDEALRFFSLDDATGTSVTILPIPEPSTLRLLALGLLLAVAGAARVRRAVA